MLRWFPFRFRFRMGRFRMDASRVRSQIRVRVLLEGGRVVSESSSREGGPEVSGNTKEAHAANAVWIICRLNIYLSLWISSSLLRVSETRVSSESVSESSSREGGPEVSGDTKEAHNANARWIICIRSVGGRLRPNANIAPEPHHGRTQEPMRTRRGINSIQYLTSSHSILSLVQYLFYFICACGVRCVCGACACACVR